jgi:septum formation protein
MAGEKALAVAGVHRGCFLVGSDTAVVVDGECLGKPADESEARFMLGRLSGRRHRVLSSVALAAPDGALREALSETVVDFATLPASWVDAYLGTDEPYDKAGAYGIQGAAGIWVRRIEGSYTGVMGLPLYETAGLLRTAGFTADAILADNDQSTGSEPE